MIPIGRTDVVHYPMVWITAINRTTGGPESIGLWAGGEDATFQIEGRTRTYVGAGGLMEVDPITSRSDLTVQSQRVQLSAVAAEVETILRMYDARQAPIDIHVARFDPSTGALIGIDRWFRGEIDKAPIATPAKNAGQATVELELVSRSRGLTRVLTAKRADETQKRRSGDRWFRYADVGAVKRIWGQ